MVAASSTGFMTKAAKPAMKPEEMVRSIAALAGVELTDKLIQQVLSSIRQRLPTVTRLSSSEPSVEDVTLALRNLGLTS